MAAVVYLLCALTSFVCAVLLFRQWRRNPVQLLLWSTLCFVGLTLNNVFLVVDLLVIEDINFGLVRTSLMFGSVVVLAYGLISDVM